jgi:Pyruvate/2-oxoacid:ferredoxin oxidoreductase gamma subunit
VRRVERELVMTGIGGQGVQLAAQVLARAAIAEGRDVQLFGSYGGMMRGGNTEATIVVAEGVIEAPPTVGTTWSAVLMHHDFSEPAVSRLRPGSVAFVNSTVMEHSIDVAGVHVVEVPATDLAIDLGAPMVASMVMLGAYVAATAIVRLDSLLVAAAEALPSYRTQHIALNERALREGFAAVDGGRAPAWQAVPA